MTTVRLRQLKTQPRRRGSFYAASLLVVALAGTLSCGGDGSTAPTPPPPPPPPPPPAPPTAVGSIPDQALEEGESVTIDASTYFRDPNGDALSYAAESSSGNVAEVATAGANVTVTATGPGTATATVTASDPGGLSANQSFGVVVSGSVEDDFDSPASLNDWESENAEVTVADGVLNLTNRTEGRLGIAERREMPAVNEWTIQARMGRTTRRASPGVVSLTGHGRFTAVRLVLRTLDDEDRDRARDETSAAASRNYEFAVFDGAAGEWLLVTNLSGASESVLEDPGEFTDLALGHESGDFVAYAGEAGAAEELFRFDLVTSEVDGVNLGEIVSDVTGLWLVNQGLPGLTAQHDRVNITGTGSDATAPDGAVIADAPDAATRNVTVAGPDGDRAALEALYRATDGPNWVDNTNWLSDAPLGDWYGVTVNAGGRVTRVELASRWDPDAGGWVPHGLSGPIPPEFGNLDELTYLRLRGNNLSGTIPEEILRLINLDTLSLGDNNLSGPIPPALGNLTALESLSLAANELTGPIPPQLGNLPHLEMLTLAWNNLSGPIPPELGRLTTLRERLDLNHNALSGPIPPELGQLATVQHLSLRDNDLTGPIPPALGNLTSLRWLFLSNNSLTDPIPPEFGGLAALEWLYLDGNGLTDRIPSELGNLASLSNLRLSHNDFSGELPESFLGLSLNSFWWNDNAELCAPDTGVFQTWFDAIEDHVPGPFCSDAGTDRAVLVALYDATDGPNWVDNRNWLSDAPLGDWYGVTVNDEGRVTRLELGGGWDSDAEEWVRHGLAGPIPPEIGKLARLEQLELVLNELTGSIPSEIGDLASLEYLRLGANALTGSIPPELGDLASLGYLNLHANGLTGPIPPELGRLSNLRTLHLGSNDLTGSIPPELGSIQGLELLALGGNDLTGDIPAEISNSHNLEALGLSQNDLTGEIPPGLGSLPSLRVLLLAENNLTGTIPPEFGNLASLEVLRLGTNDLTGTIPRELGQLSRLTELRLSENSLSGSIPPELGDLASLARLGLAANDFSGQLPASFLGLSLDLFWWQGNAGLCAPDTEAFRAWLAGIGEHQPGPFCSGGGGTP